jgi:hypothetical protein
MNRYLLARIPFGIFLIALVTLMVELLMIRVFDAILLPNLAYMIISCALFAFGLAGVYATLRPVSRTADVEKYLAGLSAALALACFAQLPLLNLNPFDLRAVPAQPLLQVLYFMLMYLTVVLPFFFGGLVLATAFSVYAVQIRRLYFFDLVGAALGAVIIVPLLRPLGPGGLLFVATALALIAAGLFRGRAGYAAVAGVLAAACVTVPLIGDGYYDFREHLDKRGVQEAARAGLIERTIWDPVSKIDVVPTTDPKRGPDFTFKHVAYDGGSQSTYLFPFDGDFADLRQRLNHGAGSGLRDFTMDAVPLAHWFKADSGAEVLIIGSAGGQETKAALAYGASHVDAIEMVRAVVDLVTGPYSHYIGNLFQDPRAHVRVDEGRTFLRSSDKKYDIIQIYSNFTTASMTYGIGATMSAYLQTADAYQEYFTHLKNDGILQINHSGYPRMITTAALAWQRLGRSDFRKHVLVYESGADDSLPTLLIKMTPWTAAEVARINARLLTASNSRDTYSLVENPTAPVAGGLPDQAYDQPQAASLRAQFDYQIAPATDDWPFLRFTRRLDQLFSFHPRADLDSAGMSTTRRDLRNVIPFDVIHFMVTGAAALLFASIFIFVPLLLSPAGRARWPNKATTMFYFSCLGAGFIIIELTLMEIFMKLIGVPLYTYSVVIFTMLLAAGLGSLSAERLDISPRRSWPVPFAGLLLFGFLLAWLHAPVFGAFLAKPMAARIAVAVAMIFPLGFFMGMPLPLGILAIAQHPRGAVAWGWAMNGLFTVIGSLVATLGALCLGFELTLMLGFALYVAAAAAFLRLHRAFGASAIPAAEPGELASGSASAA